MTIAFVDPPETAPDPSSPDFEQQMDDHLTFIRKWAPQLKLFAGEITPLVNSIATITALANNAGAWSELTGPYQGGTGVMHDGRFWFLEEAVTDITAHEPGVSGVWAQGASEVPEQFNAEHTFSAPAASVSWISPTIDLERYGHLAFVLRGLKHNAAGSTTRTLQIQVTSDGVNWSTALTISPLALSANEWHGVVHIWNRGERNAYVEARVAGATSTAAPSVASSDNAVRRMISTNANIIGVRIGVSGDSLVAGTIVPLGIGAPVA